MRLFVKVCKSCKIEKSSEYFYKHRSHSDGLQDSCKTCWNEYVSKPEMKSKRNKRNLKNNTSDKRSEYIKAWRLKNNYGITIEQLNKMRIEQWHCCKICFSHETDLLNGLYVDHCHNTGKVRALLCRDCNSAIGLMKENKQILENALNYL